MIKVDAEQVDEKVEACDFNRKMKITKIDLQDEKLKK